MQKKLYNIFTNRLFAPFVICLVFVTVHFILGNGNVYYETADDYYISKTICRDGYMFCVFSNFFLSNLIGLFQQIIPFANAYIWFELILSFVSIWAICCVFFDKYSVKTAVIISIIINSILSVNHFAIMQWTRTAWLGAIAGCLVLAHAIAKKNKNIPWFIAGSLLFILGSLIRPVVFYYCVGIMLFYYFVKLIDFKFIKKINLKSFIKNNFKRITACLLVLVLVFGSTFMLIYSSTAIQNSTSGFSEYTKYNSLRSKLLDYNIPDYNEHKEFYSSINIDENDFKMFTEWRIDDNVFTTDVLQKIVDYQNSLESTGTISKLTNILNSKFGSLSFVIVILVIAIFIGALLLFIYLTKKHPYVTCSIVAIGLTLLFITLYILIQDSFRPLFWFYIVGILITLAFAFGTKSNKFVILAITAVSVCAILYLISQGRSPGRTVYGPLTLLFCFYFYEFNLSRIRDYVRQLLKSNKKVNLFYIAISLPIILSLIGLNVCTLNRVDKIFYNKELSEYVKTNTDTFFVLKEQALLNYNYPLVAYEKHNNFTTFGNWDTHSPYLTELFAHNNIESLYFNMVDNSKVVICDYQSNAPMMEEYLTKHYAKEGTKVILSPIEEFNGITLYNAVSVSAEQ